MVMAQYASFIRKNLIAFAIMYFKAGEINVFKTASTSQL
jgi:hypothetical protein